MPASLRRRRTLHMPSHIFVQLGMWQDVAASNIVAYKAAEDLIAREHRPEGRENVDLARRPPIAIRGTQTSPSNTA